MVNLWHPYDLGKQVTPEGAWDEMKGPLLAVLDQAGKGDKTLTEAQWMCGLAGLVAAHADSQARR